MRFIDVMEKKLKDLRIEWATDLHKNEKERQEKLVEFRCKSKLLEELIEEWKKLYG
jgi:hypothetical protein